MYYILIKELSIYNIIFNIKKNCWYTDILNIMIQINSRYDLKSLFLIKVIFIYLIMYPININNINNKNVYKIY